MFSRIRAASGIAFLLALLISIPVFAKGGFSFIALAGPNLKEELRVTDRQLTTDFFAFADFSRDRTKAPVDPGDGYEITRYYIDGKREIAFDRLHYYPDAGFVYYDGIVNGSSEYDGEWYTARPGVKAALTKVLPGSVQPVAPAAEEPIAAPQRTKPDPSLLPNQPMLPIVITAGLAAILLLIFWVRRPFIR